MAINHPANGKAAEGFFVYMVSFNYLKPPKLSPGSVILIDNQAYPDAKMVYSGSVTTKPPWRIDASTTTDVLGENESAELSDPKRWSTDAALRTISVTVTNQ